MALCNSVMTVPTRMGLKMIEGRSSVTVLVFIIEMNTRCYQYVHLALPLSL